MRNQPVPLIDAVQHVEDSLPVKECEEEPHHGVDPGHDQVSAGPAPLGNGVNLPVGEGDHDADGDAAREAQEADEEGTHRDELI